MLDDVEASSTKTSQTATNDITTALDLCISARTGIVIAHVRRLVLVWLSSVGLAPATTYALSLTLSDSFP